MFIENYKKNLRSLSAIFAVITLIGFFLSAAPSPIEAAPGDLDPTFGNGGKVMTGFGSSSSVIRAIAVQSDGKIVAAGYSGVFNSPMNDFALARYNTNGTLDATFGTGGKVTTDLGYYELAFAVLIQTDGKIVAVGFSSGDSAIGSSFALVRYNPDGSLDTSFGTGGKVRTKINNVDSQAYAAALQPDGKIVVAGLNEDSRSRFALARYNLDGTLDTSFGNGGAVTTVFGNSNIQSAYDVVIQADGKIIALGSVFLARYDFALARYNTDGSLDNTFGTGGRVVTDFGNSSADDGIAIAIQADGKIVAVGRRSVSDESGDFALARYNTNGSLDASFGAGGKVITPTAEFDTASAVAIQANGKIVAAGGLGSYPLSDFVLRRYNTDGSLDTTFGAGGTVTTIINGSDEASALAIQSDGKIIAAGSSGNPQNNTSDFALVRYLGDSAATRATQFDFDGDGKADVSVFRPANGVWYLNQSASGFAGVQFGINTDKIVPADYDGDGKTDVAVFRNGTWYLQRSQSGFTGISFGEANDIPVPADYDGDGKADIAVFRPSSGTWYLQRSSLGFTGIQFGQIGDKPVAADYDGVGKADIAVYRNGTWYIQRSGLGFTSIAFGTSEDKPVPADYDGDGKADIAVFRPSNGVWYLQRSTAGFAGIAFGLGTDLPVPADYDGDGKADVAVFRQSNGTWYLQRSQAGFTGVAFGSPNDKPVPNAFVP